MNKKNAPATPAETAAPETAGETELYIEDAAPAPKRKNWFRRHIKLLVVLAVLIAAAVGVTLYLRSRNAVSAAAEYQYVRTTTLTSGSLNDSVTANGTVKSGDEASVTVSDSAKTYKVATVNVEVGDTVQEGDVIATLDTTDLEKQIEEAEQDYSDNVQKAQTSYDRAVDNYNVAAVEHENKLIDLQTSITEADEALQEAKDAQTSAQSSYDSAQSAYNSLKSAYDTATSQISAFQSAYDTALTNRTNALSTLNNAINAYNSAYEAAKTEHDGGVETPSNVSYVLSCAQDMVNAYYTYNGNSGSSAVSSASSDTGEQPSAVSGNSSSGGSNKIDVNTLKSDLSAIGIDASGLYESGTSYSDSACGQFSTANTNLTDAKNSMAVGGYSSYSALESAVNSALTTLNTASNTLEQAKNSVESAEKQVTSAHQNYDSEKNSSTLKNQAQNVEDAKTSLEQAKRTPDNLTTLKDTLSECTLTATMSGTITELNATVGSTCTGTVATIQDTDALVVEVTISADDVPSLSTGMTCNITSDATGDATITGTLTQIDPVANSSGTFGAKVKVTGDAGDLLIGIQAKVEIVKQSTDGVFTVPIDAVGTADDGTSYVLRKTGGEGVDMTFEEVTVTTGESNDYYVIISGDDLAEGDVIRSSADLTEGIVSGTTSTDDFSVMMGGGDFGGGDMAGGGGGFSGGGDMGGGGAPAGGGPGGN